MQINIKRLQRFVKTLQAMEQDMLINMVDGIEPECGTPGCHAGLAMLALDKMGIKQTEWWVNNGLYCYKDQADRLARYLFGSKEANGKYLIRWALRYPKIWGNDKANFMLLDGIAFGQDTDYFPSSVIVDHWVGVLDRLKEHRKVS